MRQVQPVTVRGRVRSAPGTASIDYERVGRAPGTASNG